MSQLQRVGDLEVGQDLKLQGRIWMIQRVGWVVMALVVIAALLGLLGRGPLSKHTSRSSAGDLTITYQRFDRLEAPTQWQVQVDPALTRQGAVELWVAQPFLQAYQIQQITPIPDRTDLGSDRLIYRFPVDLDAQEPISVTFDLKPQAFGRHTGEIGVVGGPSLQLSQFIYP